MKTFVILTTLTEEGRKMVRNTPDKIKINPDSIELLGGELLYQFALLGQYDFLTVLRVKDESAIFKITSEMGAMGTVSTMSMPAITIDAFVNDIKGG